MSGVVEIDELYIVAGHKGQPDQVKKKGRKARHRRLKGKTEALRRVKSYPVMDLIQRNGLVKVWLLDIVKHKTIGPIIRHVVKAGSQVHTDEYNIYDWLLTKYEHKRVNHGKGEYAKDEDQDGFCEVHVNTIEGFWSLLRSWLRPSTRCFPVKATFVHSLL